MTPTPLLQVLTRLVKTKNGNIEFEQVPIPLPIKECLLRGLIGTLAKPRDS